MCPAPLVKMRLECPAGHDKRKIKKSFSAIYGQSATAMTAACGRNREELLGQRPARCECRAKARSRCREPQLVSGSHSKSSVFPYYTLSLTSWKPSFAKFCTDLLDLRRVAGLKGQLEEAAGDGHVGVRTIVLHRHHIAAAAGKRSPPPSSAGRACPPVRWSCWPCGRSSPDHG